MTRRLTPYLYLLPALGFWALFTAAPFASLSRLVVYETDYITETFVGLGNLRRLFADGRFWKAIGTTGAFVIGIVPAQILASLVIALLLVDMPKRMQDVARFAFYAPSFATGIIIAQVWSWIYHPQGGLANWALGLLGIEPVYWFNTRWTAVGAISLMTVLGSLGGSVLMYLATALGIPREVYEAARIDGASPGQIRWRVVLPIISPTVLFLALTLAAGTLLLWQPIFALTNGGPDGGTATLMYSIYLDVFIYGDFGLAACKTIVLVALALGFGITVRRVSRI